MIGTQQAARARGLRLAARVAGLGGLALAITGVGVASAAETTPTSQAAEHDGRLPLEEKMVVHVGGCGCAPCWGPPAPPPRRARRTSRRGGRR
jgi:hypothetical protein